MAITGISGYNPITNMNTSSSRFSIPEFPDSMTTKDQSKLSEGEIKDKLLEMARRNTASGVYSGNPYHSNSADWLKLQQDYVSSASPNRKGIINNTLSGYGQKLSGLMQGFNRKLNLLELLMQNSRLFGTRDIGNNFINFRDASGDIIAMWNDKGWTDVPTNAEQSRSHEFMQMWHDAQIQAGEEKRSADTIIDITASGKQVDVGKLITGGTHIDMAKLAAHGITYDAASGQTNVDKTKLQQAVSRYEANMTIG